MDIIKISALGICGVMLGFLLKGTRPEYASLVTMTIGLTILGLAAGKVAYLFETLDRLRKSVSIDGTYIGQFCASICKDAGYQAIGAQIELFCKLSVMVLSMPVLLAILDTISEFMV